MRRATRLVLAAALFAAASLVPACAGSADTHPSREDCVEVRDHMVSLRLATAQAADTERARAEFVKHRAALVRSLGEPFIEECRAKPTSYVDCALDATSTGGVAACTTAVKE